MFSPIHFHEEHRLTSYNARECESRNNQHSLTEYITFTPIIVTPEAEYPLTQY